MNLEKYSQLIESSLASLGLNPTDSRCAEEGQWLLFNGETEIYIDLWEEKNDNPWLYFENDEPIFIFQVIAPICHLPAENITSFYESLLHNNLNLINASYTINKEQNILAVKIRKTSKFITQEEIIDLIEAIGYYSEITYDSLAEIYTLEKIAKEN
ncbi:MAG: hypothetical protein Q8K70_08675 [Bacteroidota bacterium]|nr:hypothetical protein [Bacteroidota bacterium]